MFAIPPSPNQFSIAAENLVSVQDVKDAWDKLLEKKIGCGEFVRYLISTLSANSPAKCLLQQKGTDGELTLARIETAVNAIVFLGNACELSKTEAETAVCLLSFALQRLPLDKMDRVPGRFDWALDKITVRCGADTKRSLREFCEKSKPNSDSQKFLASLRGVNKRCAMYLANYILGEAKEQCGDEHGIAGEVGTIVLDFSSGTVQLLHRHRNEALAPVSIYNFNGIAIDVLRELLTACGNAGEVVIDGTPPHMSMAEDLVELVQLFNRRQTQQPSSSRPVTLIYETGSDGDDVDVFD